MKKTRQQALRADLGFVHADELQWKTSLVSEIRQAVAAKGLTQAEVAALVGLDQPKISKLLAGKLNEYSVSRLLRILNRLGHNVEVRVAKQQVAPEHAQTIIRSVAEFAQ